MGQCATICSNSNKKQADINVDSLENNENKINNYYKYTISPYYSKLIHLQLVIKRFLKKKFNTHFKNKNKIKNETKNINVNINVNNNTITTNENTTNSTKNLKFENKITNNQKNQTNSKPSQNPQQQNQYQAKEENPSTIKIPTVKVDFKESPIFAQDNFKKDKKRGIIEG